MQTFWHWHKHFGYALLGKLLLIYFRQDAVCSKLEMSLEFAFSWITGFRAPTFMQNHVLRPRGFADQLIFLANSRLHQIPSWEVSKCVNQFPSSQKKEVGSKNKNSKSQKLNFCSRQISLLEFWVPNFGDFQGWRKPEFVERKNGDIFWNLLAAASDIPANGRRRRQHSSDN